MSNPQENMANVPLAFNFQRLNDISPTPSSPGIFIIFINGLMLPQAMWTPTIDLLKPALTNFTIPLASLTYDRYGQGQSRPANDPSWTPSPHDLAHAAHELSGVTCRFIAEHWPSSSGTSKSSPRLLFVSHSIGVPLVRLYSARHPRSVSAHLFLDSNMANSDFLSLFPDPDSADFDPSTLPSDTTVDSLRTYRSRNAKIFHPSATNPEGLDRSNIAELLPFADRPKLAGPGTGDGSKGPFLTVVGHDAEAFAEEGFKLTKTPRGLNRKYLQPEWEKYNRGLCGLSSKERVKGVVIAEGAGHFVQRDNPGMVVKEIVDLVGRLVEEGV